MSPGEIHLARFPLGGSGGTKLRPVLLLTGLVGPVPEVLTAYISSVIPTPLLATDLVLDPAQPEYSGTKLKTASVLRLHKLATVHQRDIVRHLGAMSATAMNDVEPRLKILLNL